MHEGRWDTPNSTVMIPERRCLGVVEAAPLSEVMQAYIGSPLLVFVAPDD